MESLFFCWFEKLGELRRFEFEKTRRVENVGEWIRLEFEELGKLVWVGGPRVGDIGPRPLNYH